MPAALNTSFSVAINLANNINILLALSVGNLRPQISQKLAGLLTGDPHQRQVDSVIGRDLQMRRKVSL
jgi:hypothetical protein